MKRRNLFSLLIILWITLAACSAGQPGVVTIEVPHIVREIQYVTVEVPRIEREIQFATVEVTRIVRETVVVTPQVPAGQWRLDVAPGISLGTPRTSHTATPPAGWQDLAGGRDGRDAMYTLVEIYDPASGALIPAAPLNTPRSGHSATLLGDNRVLVVGGYNAEQGWLADAELYDPLLNAWTVVPTLYSHGVQHSATLLGDGRVLVTGGCIASGVCSDRAELFDPQSNTWSEAAPLPTDLGSHAAALLDDGRVLVAGGAGSAGPAGGGTSYLYDPPTNSWSAYRTGGDGACAGAADQAAGWARAVRWGHQRIRQPQCALQRRDIQPGLQ